MAKVIGIDLGMMLLQTENARTGLIWRLMDRSPFTKRGLAAAGFHAAPLPDAVAVAAKPKRRTTPLKPMHLKPQRVQ